MAGNNGFSHGRKLTGYGINQADVERGYTVVSEDGLDVPPKKRTERDYPPYDPDLNYERMVWDDDEHRYIDRYHGGFVKRLPPYSTER